MPAMVHRGKTSCCRQIPNPARSSVPARLVAKRIDRFEIDHRPEADYRLWQFEAETDVLDRLNHSLKIMDGVLRFRIVRQRPGAPEVPPAPDPIRTPRAEEGDSRVAARAAADAPAEPVEQAEEPAAAPEPQEPAEAPAEADAPAPAEA